MHITRLIAAFASVLAMAGLSAAEPTAVPRYKFEPGQEMTYRSTSILKHGEKETAGEHGNQVDWTVWVMRQNKDGSFRLVVRQKNTSFFTSRGKKDEQPARSQLVYADVFADGRILPNDSIKYQGNPGPIFPKLPKDADEAAHRWSWERDGYTFTAKRLQEDTRFRFEMDTKSVMDAIYLSSNTCTYTFDLEHGRISGAEIVSSQGYGFKNKGTGTTNFVSAKAADPALFKQLAAEERGYFESLAAYNKVLQEAETASPEDAGKKLEAALASLKSANKALSDPVLKADLDSHLKQHEQMAKYTVESAERRAKVVGKPAEPFATTDINGKSVKLEDLKGKVVVLDFWYRGCGWCIKAMPQINALAEDFAGKPVAIFGMNTDKDEEDARFVIEKMRLKYPTLKAIGLPEKFGVQGFPTLIVIDQKGKVHDLHVGYTPTLRVDLGREIKAMLEKK